MKPDPHDLGPLPKAPQSTISEAESLKAFAALLPSDRFCLRTEPSPDAGVDKWLEIIYEGQYTNLRAQVQLKSCIEPEIRQDGVVTYRVDSSNLNYLCSGQSALYALHIPNQNEFRYCWAHEEAHRLNRINSHWKSQETVTLEFSKRLDFDSFDEIYTRVFSKAQLDRQISELIVRTSDLETIQVVIDQRTLTASDPDKLVECLNIVGMDLVAEGKAASVLDSLSTLHRSVRNTKRLLLVAAYANHMLGRFYDALGCIAELSTCTGLSVEETEFIKCMRISIDYQTGKTDLAAYRQGIGS